MHFFVGAPKQALPAAVHPIEIQSMTEPTYEEIVSWAYEAGGILEHGSLNNTPMMIFMGDDLMKFVRLVLSEAEKKA